MNAADTRSKRFLALLQGLRPNRLSLRGRLALLLIATTLALALPVGWYVDKRHVAQLIQHQGETLEAVASALATTSALKVGNRLRTLELIAEELADDLDDRDPAHWKDQRTHLDRLASELSGFDRLLLIDNDGQPRLAAGGALPQGNVASDFWFQRAKLGGLIGDLANASIPLTRAKVETAPLFFAVPLENPDGQPVGVMLGHGARAWAERELTSLGDLGESSLGLEFLIVDAAGRVLFPQSGQVPEKVMTALRDGYAIARWDDGRRWIAAGRPIEELGRYGSLDWLALVRQPRDIVAADAHELQQALVRLQLASFGLVLLVCFAGTRHLGRPLRDLAAAARQIRTGEETPNFPFDIGTPEVRELSNALRAMSSRIRFKQAALHEAQDRLEEKVRERTQALEEANRKLADLVVQDPLSGIGNRRGADLRLTHEFARFKRDGRAFSLMLLDIDHFKQVNDQHGHDIGDEVIRQVAKTIQRRVRDVDYVARFGGEEFLVVLPNTLMPGAVNLAEALREEVAQTLQPGVGQVTVSIGVATVSDADSAIEATLKRADESLYAAKASGRNRVIAA